MFMKQYNYKPRSNSTSSTGSGSGAAEQQQSASTDATKTATAGSQTAGAASTAQQSRRRSSATEKFAGLNAHKRTSQDEGAAARKASWAEQKPGQTGILGGMWNSFTKGS